MAASCAASLALGVLCLMSCASWAAAASYTVGDTSGWTTGVDYGTWASNNKFTVGDTLVFNYASSAHSVAEVSSADYASCSASNALSSDSSGTTTITLATAGKRYFICGAPGHCSSGMKLAVTVAAASSATPPSTTPSATPTPASPATPTTPSSSGGATKTPTTVLAPPAKPSAAAAAAGPATWAGLGLAALAAMQLGRF